MNRNKKLTISFDLNIISAECFRQIVARILDDFSLDRNEMRELSSAVKELYMNSLIHSGSKTFDLTIEIDADPKTLDKVREYTIKITARDYGKGIKDIDIEQAKQPLYTSSGNEERAGMGFTIVEVFTDSMLIENMNDGLQVTITKKFTVS